MKRNRVKDFLKDKGFYLVMALAIVGASAAAWVTANNTLESIEDRNSQIASEIASKDDSIWTSQADTPPSVASSAVEVIEPVVDVEKPDTTQEKPQEEVESTPPESVSTAPTPQSESEDVETDVIESTPQVDSTPTQSPYTLPLEELAVIQQYSNGQPVKNKTLNVWRAHNAVDFKGELNATVMAVSDGVITKISTDPLWGGYMEIEHPDGYTSCYSGVVAESDLKEGNNVAGGQKIGVLGEIPAEISMDTHLHYVLKKGEETVDPGKLLKLN